MAATDPFFDIKIDCASSGDNTIISGSSGKAIKIYSLILWWNGTVSVILKDAATRNLTGAMAGVAQSRFILDNQDERPWFTLTQGNAFIVNLSGAVQVSGSVRYTQAT